MFMGSANSAVVLIYFIGYVSFHIISFSTNCITSPYLHLNPFFWWCKITRTRLSIDVTQNMVVSQYVLGLTLLNVARSTSARWVIAIAIAVDTRAIAVSLAKVFFIIV